MGIRIITDSTSDISREEGAKLNIDIVPLKVNIDGSCYTEGIDLSNEEFYEKLEIAEKLPTTSTPAPEDFLAYFEEAKVAGDHVIVITLSSNLSGTYQCANLAKDILEYSNIHVIDSKQATLSQMLLVKYAVQLKNEGKNTDEIVRAIEEAKEKVVLLLVLDTLHYLYKGGRLSKGASIAGNLLKIKPIITVTDGTANLLAKSRGFKASMNTMLQLAAEHGSFDTNKPVVYGFSGNSERCECFKEKADEALGLKDTEIFSIGSVIGTYAGPKAYGFAFFKE